MTFADAGNETQSARLSGQTHKGHAATDVEESSRFVRVRTRAANARGEDEQLPLPEGANGERIGIAGESLET